MTTPNEIKGLILSFLQPALDASGMSSAAIADDTDLRAVGLLDSLRFVQLLEELERRLGVTVDLSDLDPGQLTHLGALARHIAGRRLKI